MTGSHVVTRTSHDTCSRARAIVSERMQSQPVNLGDLLQQIRRVCGVQQSQIVIESPQNVSVASVSDKVNVSGSASCNRVSVNKPRSTEVTSDPVYSYKVKVINPNKKSDVAVFYLNDFTARFDSVTSLRVKLIEAFKDRVPSTLDFNVGYYEGSQQAKIWLVTSDDLKTLYQRFSGGGQITLWCDGRAQEVDNSRKRKREESSSESGSSVAHRLENEKSVEEAYKKLLEKHANAWDTPRLRLWARMICSGCHDDYDNPPSIPAFVSTVPKKQRKDNLSEALTGAAVAFAKVVSGGTQASCTSDKVGDESTTHATNNIIMPGVSPGKAVDLRMKNYEQLRYLQQLYDDGILDQKEYIEQKQDILKFLRKL